MDGKEHGQFFCFELFGISCWCSPIRHRYENRVSAITCGCMDITRVRRSSLQFQGCCLSQRPVRRTFSLSSRSDEISVRRIDQGFIRMPEIVWSKRRTRVVPNYICLQILSPQESYLWLITEFHLAFSESTPRT